MRGIAGLAAAVLSSIRSSNSVGNPVAPNITQYPPTSSKAAAGNVGAGTSYQPAGCQSPAYIQSLRDTSQIVYFDFFAPRIQDNKSAPCISIPILGRSEPRRGYEGSSPRIISLTAYCVEPMGAALPGRGAQQQPRPLFSLAGAETDTRLSSRGHARLLSAYFGGPLPGGSIDHRNAKDRRRGARQTEGLLFRAGALASGFGSSIEPTVRFFLDEHSH